MWCLNFITMGSQSLQAYDEYKRVIIDEDGRYKVESRQTAMMHRLSIGTIVSDAMVQVKYVTGGFIGTIEESLQIADEGKARRAAAEKELQEMEGRLRDTLASAKASETGLGDAASGAVPS